MQRILLALSLVAAAAVLSGCGGSDDSELTLAQTKSPTQLLRIAAGDRLPPAAVESSTEPIDVSVACKSEADDPEGLYRLWQSSITFEIGSQSAWRAGHITEELTQSFLDDGWFVSGAKDGQERTVVTKPGTVSSIAFIVDEGDENGEGATISIDAAGPCVLTDGPESDEVLALN
jgi:hypothetical protein